MFTDQDAIIFISEDEAGERLDKILARRFVEINSRTYFQTLIADQHVLLNGVPVRKGIKPDEGDEVQVHFVLTPEIGLTAEEIPLNILYEDDHLIIVNKPAGMVVHPAAGHWNGTFVNALLHHCKQLVDDGSLRPGIVHRLDKDTSGALLAAKTTIAQQRLVEMFANRQIHKEYLAICLGNPGVREMTGAVGRHPIHRQRMAVTEKGKPALTFCKTIKTDGKLSVVELILATGRTHQIRVHLQDYGTPVLGDSLYGNVQTNAKYGAARQQLHAKSLRFIHPCTHVALEIHAPLPDDMLHWTLQLGQAGIGVRPDTMTL